MDAYIWIPLASCLLAALSAVVIVLRDPGHIANRLAGVLIGGAAWWGVCQLLWMASDDAHRALTYHKLGSFGWAFIAPLSLHLIREVTRHPGSWIPRALPGLYALSVGWIVVHLFTPWLYPRAVPASFGWGFEAGPMLPAFLATTLAITVPAIVVGLERVRTAPSPAERRQVRLVALGVSMPLVLATATGGILPMLGISCPRLGPLSFGLLGVTIAWALTRYGFSALAPGRLSREILETLPDGLALVGPDGRVLVGNDRIAELLGIPVNALQGHLAASALSVDILHEAELREVECQLTPERGSRVPVGISTSMLRDKRGLKIGVVLVVRDLREVVALRSHLATSGRLAAVGELAAGIAHEINNPMAFVRANLTQLEAEWRALAERVPEPGRDGAFDALVSEGEDLIRESIEGVHRTSEIVQDVKGFAHAGNEGHRLVDLPKLLRGVLRIAQPQLRYRAEVSERLDDVPAILGSDQELKQVFLNLIVNASQAIESAGRVDVATCVNGDGVDVVVSDDGCGISEADRERIFDPFFTTKPVGEGTGLGLAISYQILRRHDAEIAVESEPGEGTTFTVRFPIPQPEAEPEAAS